MMDGKKLIFSAAALVALAIIVLMGIAVIGGFSYTLRTDTTADLTSFTLPSDVGVVKSFGSSYPFTQDLTSCVNVSGGDAVTTSQYSIAEGDLSGGTITWLANDTVVAGDIVNCSIQYLAANDNTVNATKFVTGLTVFATFSGILVLALLGMVIINIFKKGGN